MTATAIAPVAERQGFLYRDLVSDKLWERLVGRVVKDEGVERLVAEQIVDAGLGFVKLIADHPGHSFAPSPMVDIGWHTLILYTRHYAALCQQLAGRFIHHEPNDDPDNPSTAGGPRATVAFMEAHGVAFNPVVWTTGLRAQNCENTSCGPDDGDRCSSGSEGGEPNGLGG